MIDTKQNAIQYTRERCLKAAIFELIDDHETLRREVNELRNHNKYLESRVSEESDCATLRATVVKLEAEVVSLREAAVHIYNSGYSAGHHYTVEGSYVDIHSSDMDSYHAEEVAELLAALVGEEWE